MKLFPVIILFAIIFTKNQSLLLSPYKTISNPNYGEIIGRTMLSAGNRSHFFAYRGIPYAEPPIGDLRFRPPVPYNSSSVSVLNATEDKNVCIQLNKASSAIIGSEDCLFVNVYVPGINANGLPVLVYLHGGAFIYGNGAYYYRPDFLMDKNIIYVSLNYRLGPFGFLSTEDMVVPGNNGLKDQILALKWIKDNIVYFGGDPNKVTLMGESAGGASTSYLAQSPKAKGLFKRAIMMSGNTLDQWSLTRNPRKTAFELGVALGIHTNSSDILISQMRLLAAATISLKSYALLYSRLNPLKLIFGPVKEPKHNGSVFSDFSYRILREATLNPDEIMIGVTSAEANRFLKLRDPNNYTSEDFTIPESLHILNANIRTEVAQKVNAHYFPNDTVTLADAAKLLTDTFFVRSTAKYIELASARNVIYAYEFTYVGHLGNQGQLRTLEGVGHAEDLAYIFQHPREPSPVKAVKPNDQLTRRRWIQLITNFVITGNPTPTPDELLQNLDWNSIPNPNNISYLEFDQNLVMKSNIHPGTVEFWNNIFNQYAVQPLDTY